MALEHCRQALSTRPFRFGTLMEWMARRVKAFRVEYSSRYIGDSPD